MKLSDSIIKKVEALAERMKSDTRSEEKTQKTNTMKKECKYILLPTEKESTIFLDENGKIFYSINIDQEQKHFKPQHLYVLSNYEIKDVQYTRQFPNISSYKNEYFLHDERKVLGKIIATTNPELIKNGVASIDNKPKEMPTGMFAPSDLEYIISLYNEKSESDHNPHKHITGYIRDRFGEKEALAFHIKFAQPSIKDNADKRFGCPAKEDWQQIESDHINWFIEKDKLTTSDEEFVWFKKRMTEWFERPIAKERPKRDTVMVEYYEEVSPMGDGSAWFPKTKDGCIVLKKKNK